LHARERAGFVLGCHLLSQPIRPYFTISLTFHQTSLTYTGDAPRLKRRSSSAACILSQTANQQTIKYDKSAAIRGRCFSIWGWIRGKRQPQSKRSGRGVDCAQGKMLQRICLSGTLVLDSNRYVVNISMGNKSFQAPHQTFHFQYKRRDCFCYSCHPVMLDFKCPLFGSL